MTALKPPDRLATARLCLRKPTMDDAQALFDAYASDPDVPRYMTWVPHKDVSETRSFLEDCLAGWRDGTMIDYIIERRSAPIGMIGFHARPHRVNFGYVLARPHWGNGYMPEALTALVDWALDQDDIHRAQAYCDVDNPASARVMEKAGMVFEGIVRRYSLHPNVSDVPRDCFMYAKVR